MVTPPAPPQRCRTCGAVVAANADWCSLCLTPVAEPPEAGSAAATLPPPRDPPTARTTPPPSAAERPLPAGIDPDEWAARLAAEEGHAGRLAPLTNRSTRVAIMVGGALAIIVVLGLGMLVLSRIAG